MRSTLAVRAMTTFLMMAMLFGSFSADLVAQSLEPTPSIDSLIAQVVVNPAAASNTIGPARQWDRVDPAYRYYYGPNHGYDSAWYGQRHLAYPNNYVSYASDPGGVCSTEYYYMPSDSLYYCYQPDPVALNSGLQTRCPNQPYLYFCPEDLY
jgi:hypothetical protein